MDEVVDALVLIVVSFYSFSILRLFLARQVLVPLSVSIQIWFFTVCVTVAVRDRKSVV